MSDLFMGSTIAGCRLDAVAGRGGMGVVYRATQLALDRLVALKAMAPQLAEDADYRERFQRESHIAASIDHPNVIPVYEAGELDGTLYLIMRWVDGTDLRALLTSSGALPPQRAVRLLRPVASALAAAHRRGLVHRDIKPANVLIARGDGEEDEHVYLTDFGIARRTDGESAMTRTGVLVGTLDYTAPERIEGGKGNAASDIYAFGCMLFEALTGHVPFDRQTELTKMYAHLNDPVPQARREVPGVPERLDAIIAKAMAKRPEDRFASASELVSALGRALEVETAEAGLRGRRDRSELPTDETVPAVDSTEPVTAGIAAPETEIAAPETEIAAPETEIAAPETPPTVADPSAGTTLGAPLRASTEVDWPEPGRRSTPRPRALLLALALLVVVVAGIVALVAGSGGGAKRDHPTLTGAAGVSGTSTGTAPTGPEFQASGLKRGLAVDLGATPIGVSASPDGNVWASVPGSSAIVRINPVTGLRRTFSVGGRPGEIAAGPGGVWVSGSDGPLARYDLQSGQLLVSAKLTRAPDAIAVDPKDGSAWVTDSSGMVTHVGTDGLTITETRVTPAAADIGLGEPNWIWVVNGTQNLVRIGPGANGSQETFDTRPGGIAVTFDRGVWVAHANGHVTRFNPETKVLSVNTDRAVAPELDAIAAHEQDPFVWAISKQTRTLYQISVATGAPVAGKVLFPSPPVALTVDNGSVWVATEDGKVTQIRF
jgi:serine/threonine protein kinase/streptogramin lyase